MITVSDKFGVMTLPTAHQAVYRVKEQETRSMPEITQEELDRLRALQPATVTIDAAEYQRLKANQSQGIDPALHQRVAGRLAEIEQLLRREMADHAAEIAQMTTALEQKRARQG